MKKLYILPILLILFFTLNAQAKNNPKLFGHWKGSSVSLKLQPNGKYHYRLNSVVKFSGKWTSTGKTITLYYRLLGVKSNKQVKYKFDGDDLIIKKSDRPNVRLKKVK